jgi:hypothetical protein
MTSLLLLLFAEAVDAIYGEVFAGINWSCCNDKTARKFSLMNRND